MAFLAPALAATGGTGGGIGMENLSVGSTAGTAMGAGGMSPMLEGLQSFTGAVANPFSTLTGGSEIGQALDMLQQISSPLQMAQLAPLPQSQVFAVPKRLRRRLGQ